jgi:hypothetical protein
MGLPDIEALAQSQFAGGAFAVDVMGLTSIREFKAE